MPSRPRRRCTADARCPNPALDGGKCVEHARQADAERNERRAFSREVYLSERWRRLRAFKLTRDPYCQSPGCNRPAEHVDHVRRIEDGGDPWNLTNLQALCQPHHSQKTARETGFGGAHE